MTPRVRSSEAGTSRKVNKRYFRHLLEDRQMSQRQLAKLMDMDQSSLVRAFQGKRAFTTHETAKLSKFLHVPLEEVLRNLDVDVPGRRHTKGDGGVAVVGTISQGEVAFGKAEGPRVVDAPPQEAGAGLQALLVNDDGPLHGAYIYFRPAADVHAAAIGKLCICAVQDGGTRLAIPRSAQLRDTYNLHDLGGRIVERGVWLEAASPVVWIKTP